MKYSKIHIQILSTLAAVSTMACGAMAPQDELTDPEQGNYGISQQALSIAADIAIPISQLPSEQGDYYTIRQDFRRCASPLCGGFFVHRVNRARTECSDGARRSECYVADLELSELGLSDNRASELRSAVPHLLVRGEMAHFPNDHHDHLEQFVVTEAWTGHADAVPTGRFLRVEDSEIVCVVAPCNSLKASTLNHSRRPFNVAELDLSNVSDDPSDGLKQLREPDGVLVAARGTRIRGLGGSALGLLASEYYMPFGRGPQSCGSRGQRQCATDEFCQFPIEADCGRTDRGGSCEATPEACIEVLEPVCGCDGATYSNTCEAHAHGVSVDFDGACEPSAQICGGFLGVQCAKGQFCNFSPEAQCGQAEAAGVCEPIPQLCRFDFAPVCGCDGESYGNECGANSAGVSVSHFGACEPACKTKPLEGRFCITVFDPVCGCDGQTYSNSCVAAVAGVRVVSEGSCEAGPLDQ